MLCHQCVLIVLWKAYIYEYATLSKFTAMKGFCGMPYGPVKVLRLPPQMHLEVLIKYFIMNNFYFK